MESSDTVGYEILKLLGIDTEHAYSADVRMVAGEPIEVIVTYKVISTSKYDPVAVHTNVQEYVLLPKSIDIQRPKPLGRSE